MKSSDSVCCPPKCSVLTTHSTTSNGLECSKEVENNCINETMKSDSSKLETIFINPLSEVTVECRDGEVATASNYPQNGLESSDENTNSCEKANTEEERTETKGALLPAPDGSVFATDHFYGKVNDSLSQDEIKVENPDDADSVIVVEESKPSAPSKSIKKASNQRNRRKRKRTKISYEPDSEEEWFKKKFLKGKPTTSREKSSSSCDYFIPRLAPKSSELNRTFEIKNPESLSKLLTRLGECGLNKVRKPSNGTILPTNWVCCLCLHRSNVADLGDLFGPYYVPISDPLNCPVVETSEIPKPAVKSPKQNGLLSPSRRSRPRRNSDEDRLFVDLWIHGSCAFWSQCLVLFGPTVHGIAEISEFWEQTCGGCGKRGASVGCVGKSCGAAYHYPCAVEKGFAFQANSLVSVCSRHKKAHAQNFPFHLDLK